MLHMKISWDKFTEQNFKANSQDWIEERNSRRHVKTYLFTVNSLDPQDHHLHTK